MRVQVVIDQMQYGHLAQVEIVSNERTILQNRIYKHRNLKPTQCVFVFYLSS